MKIKRQVVDWHAVCVLARSQSTRLHPSSAKRPRRQ